MIEPSECLASALEDFGTTALIDGNEITVLFNHAPAQADPYMDDRGHDGPSACALIADLQELALWPLPVSEITVDEQLYRIVRQDACAGEVTLYLRES